MVPRLVRLIKLPHRLAEPSLVTSLNDSTRATLSSQQRMIYSKGQIAGKSFQHISGWEGDKRTLAIPFLTTGSTPVCFDLVPSDAPYAHATDKPPTLLRWLICCYCSMFTVYFIYWLQCQNSTSRLFID